VIKKQEGVSLPASIRVNPWFIRSSARADPPRREKSSQKNLFCSIRCRLPIIKAFFRATGGVRYRFPAIFPIT